MKYLTTLFALALCISCASKKNNVEAEMDKPETTMMSDTDTLIEVKRGGCYGKCPIDNTVILNNGHVIYFGKKFVDHIGDYTAQLSPEALANLKSGLKTSGFFGLAERYPEDPLNRITDLPTVTLTATSEGMTHQIHNSHDAPKALNDFQKLLTDIIAELDYKAAVK